MSEWLDLMLGEIERKKREKQEALEELERRKEDAARQEPDATGESPADGK